MYTLEKCYVVAGVGYSQTQNGNHFHLIEPLIPQPKLSSRPNTTNMRRFFSSLFLILPFLLFIVREAEADPFQTLTVPANGTKVTSNFLPAGNYQVVVSGNYVWGKCNPMACPKGAPDYLRWADPAFLTDDHWASFVTNPRWTNNVYFEINGSRAGFTNVFGTPPTSPDSTHTYYTTVHSNGGPATFAIHDCSGCYGDNSGFLTAEIRTPDASGVSPVGSSLFSWSAQAATVPEPSSLGLLGASIIGLGLVRRRKIHSATPART